jgi:uncharacterized membrane protein YphA (DoxX/SURF4 family)
VERRDRSMSDTASPPDPSPLGLAPAPTNGGSTAVTPWVWVPRLLAAGVFFWAGAAKVLDPATFLAAIETYRLLPGALARAVAVWLPWVELCAAVGLFLPTYRRAAAWLLLALMASFTIALGLAWARGLDITCGCFGRSETVSGAAYLRYLARDVALLGLLGTLVALQRRR